MQFIVTEKKVSPFKYDDILMTHLYDVDSPESRAKIMKMNIETGNVYQLNFIEI